MDSPFAQAYSEQAGIQSPFGEAYKQMGGTDLPDISETPADVTNAKGNIGDSIDKGYCQSFVEQMTGSPKMGRSAAEAFQNYEKLGKVNPDIAQAPAGSLIYFQPDQSNGGDGHVGIKDENGNLISATYKGIESIPLSQWIANTGQTPMGYVQP